MPDFLAALPAALTRSWTTDAPPSPARNGAASAASSQASIATADGAEGPAGQATAGESAPYFGFAPADDSDAPLTANALYFRIQVRQACFKS